MAYFIHTEVTLRLGKMPAYAEMMERLAPYLADYGWTLVQALQPVTGDFRKVVHIWRLDEFASVERGLAACTSEEGRVILAPMADLVETEAIQVMASAPYA